MPLDLTILYRGTLSSCNYDCGYCPFAKHWESPEELAEDQTGLERFVNWVANRTENRLAVFFTPWGEALVRHWYRQAITELSWQPHVHKVAVQTNLSCQLGWLRSANVAKLGFWCTYHPGQVSRNAFLDRCRQLTRLGVQHSVGCVGLREHLPEIVALRRELPDNTYIWINAYKSQSDYYDQPVLETFQSIDPLFAVNNMRHPSRGRSCRTGQSVISVDSAGDVRRCHFVKETIGNIFTTRLEEMLRPRSCPNATCSCHIGYVHLEHLKLDQVFGNGILERVPLQFSSAGSPAGSRSQPEYSLPRETLPIR